VDPYTQCFQFLLYTLVPVFIARVALFVYYLKSEDRARIQYRVEEAFFMLQIFWSGSYGYWTLYNFFSLSRGSLNCLAKGQFSQMKIAYQVVMVCGGFPAVLCIGGFVFVMFALPFIVYDYVKREYRKKENDRRRNMLNKTLFRCSYHELKAGLGSDNLECCICLSGLEESSHNTPTTPIKNNSP
jgi:hypothetical protein